MSIVLFGILLFGLVALAANRAYILGRNAGLENGQASSSDRLIEKFHEGYGSGYEKTRRVAHSTRIGFLRCTGKA
jgi:hypothetical protein